MLGQVWYHGLVRKYVTLFGSLFNDIYISRVDSDGDTVKSIKVPLAYGPKERYLTREIQNDDLLRPVSLVYPRMAFEMTSINYDPQRKLNTAGKCITGSVAAGTLKTQLNPVPYNIGFKLSIIARNTDDALRIVEQILPFFTPYLNTQVTLIPEMNYDPVSIPITLNNVDQQDFYEESFESKEYIIWELDFTMKAYFYGPTGQGKVIKEITVNFFTPETATAKQGVGISPVQEHVYIRPGLTANGEPTTSANNSVPVANISYDDDYGFIVEFYRDV